jgi:hypothetical protein
MKKKFCSKCGQEKLLNDFPKTGKQCKDCKSIYMKIWRENNKDRVKELKKSHYIKNKEKFKESNKKWKQDNKDYNNKYQKEYREKNKESIEKYREQYKDRMKELQKSYYIKNKEKRKTYIKEYYQKNKEKILEYNREYVKKRCATDTLFKSSHNIRSLIFSSFKNGGFRKNTKTYQILGCSFDEFKKYIENQFESWMGWKNHGKYNGEFNYGWDFDHIIPSSIATTEEDIIKLNHYTNFQPLCSKINRDIKIDNKDYEKERKERKERI